MEKNKIAFVVDLADSEENMKAYFADAAFDSPYTAGLYQNGQIVLLDMGSSYTSEVYQRKVAEGMRAMMNAAGPAYIHCMEGKDRTGFVCMLLEALAGASYEQMQRSERRRSDTTSNLYHTLKNTDVIFSNSAKN